MVTLFVAKSDDIASACISESKIKFVIPREVLGLIFQNSSPETVRTCCFVSKEWRNIALSNNVLMHLFPEAALPEGMTKQKWLLQGIHCEEDLRKIVRYSHKRESNPWIRHVFSSSLGTIKVGSYTEYEQKPKYFYHYSTAFWARRYALTSLKDNTAITPSAQKKVALILSESLEAKEIEQKVNDLFKGIGVLGGMILTSATLLYMLPSIDKEKLDGFNHNE